MHKPASTIVLGGGCFWCIEAVFQKLDGILEIVSGYSGGTLDNPDYRQVCHGTTGHAEVVRLTYNSDELSLERILHYFFLAHDPTQEDGQGNDIGPQYRSVIYYEHEADLNVIRKVVEYVSQDYSKPMTTEIKPLEKFWPAEDKHQNYYATHKEQRYCRIVIKSKLDKIDEMLKKETE